MSLFNVGEATLALTDSAQFLLCDLFTAQEQSMKVFAFQCCDCQTRQPYLHLLGAGRVVSDIHSQWQLSRQARSEKAEAKSTMKSPTLKNRLVGPVGRLFPQEALV